MALWWLYCPLRIWWGQGFMACGALILAQGLLELRVCVGRCASVSVCLHLQMTGLYWFLVSLPKCSRPPFAAGVSLLRLFVTHEASSICRCVFAHLLRTGFGCLDVFRFHKRCILIQRIYIMQLGRKRNTVAYIGSYSSSMWQNVNHSWFNRSLLCILSWLRFCGYKVLLWPIAFNEILLHARSLECVLVCS